MTAPRRLAAILAADVAGYSRLMAADEAGTLARFKLLRSDHVEPAVRRHNGRIVGEAGDSLLVEFPTASDAVACAVEVQEKLAALNADLPEDRRMRFRMGVNLGEVIVDGATIHGDGVNIAARLEKLAEPGGIVVAHAVREQAKGRVACAFENLGDKTLHNIAEAVRVYSVVPARVAQAQAGTSTVGPESRAIVAVLPFANMSGDAEQEYFSDGITEDLITALSKSRHLAVLARNSTFSYKGRSVKVQDIGRDLGARYVVEGSVRKGGNRVRVTAQLIDADSGAHIWAEKFDRDLSDIFVVQDEIVSAIAAQLPGSVLEATTAHRPVVAAVSPSAYDHYLRGVAAWRRGADAETLAHLLEAVVLNPCHGATHGWLAFYYAYATITGTTGRPVPELESLAKHHVEQALVWSDDDPVMHNEVGVAHLCLGDLPRARHHIERAHALNPFHTSPKIFLGCMLVYDGLHAEGLARIEGAFWLDPHMAPAMRDALFESHYIARDYSAAIADFTGIEKPYPYHFLILAAAYAQLARTEDARRALADFEAHRPPGYDVQNFLRYLTRICQRPEDREHWLEGFRKAGVVP